MTTRRYCLQKLVLKDVKAKLETWVNTNFRSNNIIDLENFNTENYRIYDTLENKVVSQRFNDT